MLGFDINRECIIGSQKGRKMKIELTSPEVLAQRARKNAKIAREILEERNLPNADDVQKYIQSLRDMIHCPTSAMLAQQEQGPVVAKANFRRNKKYLGNDVGKTKALTETSRRIYGFNYPNTGKLRKYIIKHNRISLDKVLPRKGYNRLQKVLIRMILRK